VPNEFIIRKAGSNWENVKAWKQHLESLPDGRYRVSIVRANRRSTQQNRYYWGLVIPILKQAFYDLGHDLSAEDVHDFLKAKFNSKEIVNEETGEAISVPISTTNLNKEDFGIYIEEIQRFAAMFLNVNIPDPNTQLEIL
jgi:hypothetical protein